jgi:hypothetical protein
LTIPGQELGINNPVSTQHTEELPTVLTEVMETFPMPLTFLLFHFLLDLSMMNSLDFLHQTFQQPVVPECGLIYRIQVEYYGI